MGLFNQFANVVEWEEFNDEMIFWKWNNKEIKKSSRLIIKPGQDAIFLYNGKVEGIFTDEGNYEIDTDIIPFLSTLKGFKFGFNSGLRAEVLFINTKEITVKWGTKNPINIKSDRLSGGIPIRSFGTFSIKIDDYMVLIDKIAGIKQSYTINDVKERVISILDQLLMKWILKEGKDIFNLQSNSFEIAKGIKMDLDMELIKIGLTITDFKISSFNYPEQIQKMIEKTASYNMVDDIDRYQKVGIIDSITEGKGNVGNIAGSFMEAGMGMATGVNMANQMLNTKNSTSSSSYIICPKCGAKLQQPVKFCSECGQKLDAQRFCSECGAKLNSNARFCSECGAKNV